jgi:hypothetical protein
MPVNKENESHIDFLEGVLKRAHRSNPVREIPDDLIKSIVDSRPLYPEKENVMETLYQLLLPSVAVSWSIAMVCLGLFLFAPSDDPDDLLVSEIEAMDLGVFLSKVDL